MLPGACAVTIQRLRPARTDPPLIRCEAIVEPPTHDDQYRRRRFPDKPDQCRRMSAIVIDDRCYCRLHAGGIALERWLLGKLVERAESDVTIHV